MIVDQDIYKLIGELKPLPENFLSFQDLKLKHGHKERDIDLQGVSGSHFRIIIRQNNINSMDFSVILAYHIPGTNTLFRLRRYNGKHSHSNKLEGTRFDCVHIHQATERYQRIGFREDTYAEETNKYYDLRSALECLYRDCNFKMPPNSQPSLF